MPKRDRAGDGVAGTEQALEEGVTSTSTSSLHVDSSSSSTGPNFTSTNVDTTTTTQKQHHHMSRIITGRNRAAEGEQLPQKKYFRQRAHMNPLSSREAFVYPISPERMPWGDVQFPLFSSATTTTATTTATTNTTTTTTSSSNTGTFQQSLIPGKYVEVADIGCGFGGLIVGLAPVMPHDTLMVGLEIREKVSEYVRLRILAIRRRAAAQEQQKQQQQILEAGNKEASISASTATTTTTTVATESFDGNHAEEEEAEAAAFAAAAIEGGVVTAGLGKEHQDEDDQALLDGNGASFQNISVLRTNAMKYTPNHFMKGQLTKIFICFPDPQFKPSHHRRRIVTTPLLAEYAYALKAGTGIFYTITDVLDMHNWMAAHAEAHPCFVRMAEAELEGDPCVKVMTENTEEGKKVARLGGKKYVAVFRRVSDEEAFAKAQKQTNGDFWTEPTVEYEYTPAPSQVKYVEELSVSGTPVLAGWQSKISASLRAVAAQQE